MLAAMFQQICLDCAPEIKRAKRVAANKLDQGPQRGKNLQAKTVKRADAYEIWTTSRYDRYQEDVTAWTWYVRKKWQVDDDRPYARWFCDVVTPHVPRGESGDVYVKDIKNQAWRVK